MFNSVEHEIFFANKYKNVNSVEHEKKFCNLRAREYISLIFEMILLFLSFGIIVSIATASDVSVAQMRTCGLHPRYF